MTEELVFGIYYDAKSKIFTFSFHVDLPMKDTAFLYALLAQAQQEILSRLKPTWKIDKDKVK